MRTLAFLGELLDVIVIGSLKLIFSWAIIPIAFIAMLIYSHYQG